MANVFAIKTGNWSDSTVWNTGALPTTSDDVFANGFTVTINQNISVLSIRTQSASGINAGGGFTLPNPFNITANIIAGTTVCLTVSATTGTINIVGDSTGGTVANSSGINSTSTAIINHTGNLFGGTALNTNGVLFSGTGIYNLTGNCTGGTGGNAHGIINSSTGTINITGNCIGSSSLATGIGCNNNASGTVIITGSCIANQTVGANNNSTGILSATSAIATTGSSTSIAGINGVSISGTTLVKNIIFGSNGQNPLSGFVRFQNLADITVNVPRIGSTAVTLQDLNNAANVVPIASNVRSGVSYNAGNNVGTLIVPLPSDVRKSVQTDSTLGTADLTPSNFWGALTSENNITGSFGKLFNDFIDVAISSRLANSAYSNAPTAVQIRTEIDSNSTKLAAIPTNTLLTNDSRLNNLDATISSRLASGSYIVPPSTLQIRNDLDTNSTKLSNLDATISSRLASGSYIVPPTVAQVRTEMDTNSTKLSNLDATISSRASAANLAAIPTNPLLTNDSRLNNLDATISSRLASGSYIVPPTAIQIRTEIDTNSTKLDATISSRLATSDYSNAPTAVQIRTEIDSNSTKLANLDATISSRASQISINSLPEETWNYSIRGLTESPDVPTSQEISQQVWIDMPDRLENVATANIVAEQLLANLP